MDFHFFRTVLEHGLGRLAPSSVDGHYAAITQKTLFYQGKNWNSQRVSNVHLSQQSWLNMFSVQCGQESRRSWLH